MSYTDEESNNDNINEYDSGSDSSGFSDDDQKIKLLSKKQKQILAFQGLVRVAKQHFNNSEFLNFQQDLKAINNAIMKNKWTATTYQMPKFFVKHMLEIYNKIKQIDPKNEKNQKEQRALKSLKKNFEKDLKHFIQLGLFIRKEWLWKNESSDLGEMEHEDIEESDDDNAFISVQDVRDTTQDKKTDDPETKGDEASSEASGGTDDDSSDEEFDSDDDTWSSWDEKQPHKHEESADSSDDGSDADHSDHVDDTEATKEKTFGIEAFDEETLAKMRHRSFWVKRDSTKIQHKKKPRKPKKVKTDDTKNTQKLDHKHEKKEHKKAKKNQRGGTKWSVNKIRTIFQNVLTDRGKTSVNRDVIVSRLEELIVQCALHEAEQARLTVMSVLISFYFDTASRKTTGMSGTRWRKTRGLLGTMLKSLSKNIGVLRVSNAADIRLILKDDDGKKDKGVQDEWMAALMEVEDDGGDGVGGLGGLGGKGKESGNKIGVVGGNAGFSVINTMDSKKKKKKLDAKYQWIHGNLLSFIKKLTIELWTNLKSLASKSALYEKRKQNTELLMITYKKAVFYFGKLNRKSIQAEIEVLAMSAIHSDYNEKLDELKLQLQKKTKKPTDEKKKKKLIFGGKSGKKECIILNIASQKECIIVSKAQFVFKNGSVRAQTAAMLYLIFFMALHNRFSLCRDLLLMSHLGSQTRIGSCGNIELQILYNRAISRFAVCAFFAGHWKTTMIILQELFSSNRYKILLAQGFIRAPPDISTSEQIKLKQLQESRMFAPHFHIHADMLEAAHLLSSLFCEIPNMMHNTYTNGFIRNAYFRKVWHQYLRRDLRVPPENTKDFILSTGIYMQNGEWQSCKLLCKKLKLWAHINTNYGREIEKYVLKKVFSSIKRECLRCYLYRYGSCYKDISIQLLSEMFDLSFEHCKQFISSLINKGKEIKFASFDELTQCITIHSAPCMPIQKCALEYSEKLSFLIEQNEKLLGIYSRYSSYGGGRGGGDKWKSKGKDGKDQNKNKGQKNKNMAQKKRGGGRFTRSGNTGNDNRSRGGQQDSKNRGQFGYKQTVRTQLRSIRPKRT